MSDTTEIITLLGISLTVTGPVLLIGSVLFFGKHLYYDLPIQVTELRERSHDLAQPAPSISQEDDAIVKKIVAAFLLGIFFTGGGIGLLLGVSGDDPDDAEDNAEPTQTAAFNVQDNPQQGVALKCILFSPNIELQSERLIKSPSPWGISL